MFVSLGTVRRRSGPSTARTTRKAEPPPAEPAAQEAAQEEPASKKRRRSTWRPTSGQLGALTGIAALVIAGIALYRDSFHGGAPATAVRVSDPTVEWWAARPLRQVLVQFFVTNASRHDESVTTTFALVQSSSGKHRFDLINVIPEGVTPPSDAITLTPGEARGFSALVTMSGLKHRVGDAPYVQGTVRTGDGRLWISKNVKVRLPPSNPLNFPLVTTAPRR